MTGPFQGRWLPSKWFEPPSLRPERLPSFEILVVAVLFFWNLAVNLVVPEAGAFAVVASGLAVLLFLGRRSGAGWDQLGLDPGLWSRGLRLGALGVGVVAGVVVVAGLLPATRDLLADDRFIGVSTGEMVYEVFVRIPLVTALGEELAFRGVLLGLLLAWYSPFRAAVLSSALFGLWHVLPGVDALETTTATEFSAGVMGAVSVAGQVLVTGFAGMVFGWLRLRGGSILAPVLTHWGLNGTAYVAGWLIVSNSWA